MKIFFEILNHTELIESFIEGSKEIIQEFIAKCIEYRY